MTFKHLSFKNGYRYVLCSNYTEGVLYCKTLSSVLITYTMKFEITLILYLIS